LHCSVLSSLSLCFARLSSHRSSCSFPLLSYLFFFSTESSTTQIYTLSLHDALPIWRDRLGSRSSASDGREDRYPSCWRRSRCTRSEEHTSELQSRFDLVCRLLLEKKNQKPNTVRGGKNVHSYAYYNITNL